MSHVISAGQVRGHSVIGKAQDYTYSLIVLVFSPGAHSSEACTLIN